MWETRWACRKSRDIGRGFKAVLCGSPRTTNGVGIIVSERFRDSIVSVERFDDRLMKIIVAAKERLYHFFSAYAPQGGCSNQAKDEFWNLLDEKTAEVPSKDVIIVAGDLNGHLSWWLYGSRNADGERILDYAESRNLTVVNIVLRKRNFNLISYCCGSSKSQIDFVLAKDRDRGLVTDAKVVPYETVEAGRAMRCSENKVVANEREGSSCDFSRAVTDGHNCRRSISELGITKPGRRKVDKQAWLWTNDVKAKVREKKPLYHVFLGAMTADNWRKYTKKRRNCKEGRGCIDGERHLHRLAKNRHRQTEDIEKFFGINDENGHLLMDRKKALKRWRDYFEEISTAELPHPAIPSTAPTHGPVQKVNVEEKEAALKKTGPGKATGPEDMASDLWKSMFWNPAEWLAKIFNQIVAEKKVPDCWSQLRRFRFGRRRAVLRTASITVRFACFCTA
ncbi:unnamed protein product [Heligmosomoides polygyrus]|uniref:Endo/exonuclease/phosphatase domain-containing protein n=1 Tax=Heligmosomoides polygyrus TaxID=6339 RepID=A0A3P7XZ43_HELPZ|nr:unnamed protein product [Heligmosomoides polygyrus]